MKKIAGIIRDILVGTIIIGFMLISFFGAVLKESYKLCPLTADEVAAEVQEYGN